MGYCLSWLGIFSLLWPFYAYFLGFWPEFCILQEWNKSCILAYAPMWHNIRYYTNHTRLICSINHTKSYYIQIENYGIEIAIHRWYVSCMFKNLPSLCNTAPPYTHIQIFAYKYITKL